MPSESANEKAGLTVSDLISRLKEEEHRFIESQTSPLTEETIVKKLSHPNQRTPILIDWNKRCPGINFDFIESSNIPLLPTVPSVSQESIVIDDLILCLQGISGRYIHSNPVSKPNEVRTFVINEKLDKCWVQLANMILPMASYYSVLTRFIEEKRQFHQGQVNQALSSCLYKIKNDHLSLVAKLENQHRRGDLNLYKFHSEIQPYLHSFEVINNICQNINERKCEGGRTLSLLYEFAGNTTGKEKQLCVYLLETSAVPYMRLLQNWLYLGVITDPFNEFLIQDNQIVFDRLQLPEEYSNDYWEKCYTLNRENVPVFLDKSKNMILSTGKYLNVLRQCGVKTKSNMQEIIYNYQENKYTEIIQKAYQFASANLLTHLMVDNDLVGHLKSVKRYLLFDQGDFIMKFMDMSEHELNQEIGEIVPSKLQTLVELALRTSSACADPYKDNIKTDLHQYDVMTLLLKIIQSNTDTALNERIPKGWESLTFFYEAKWPVSLVLNESSLMIYQLMFRHLFYCKYVERLLCKVWAEHKGSKCLPTKISRGYTPAWNLRQKILLFVQNLEYYMMVEVIEPNWHIFMSQLKNAKNLDDVLSYHNTFQLTCLSECMLVKPEHFKILNKFLRKCVEFCVFLMTSCSEMKSPVHIPNQTIVEFKETESFSKKISSFNKAFTVHLQDFFKAVSEASRNNDKLIDVLYRLDFNYYKINLDDKRSDKSSSRINVQEVSG